MEQINESHCFVEKEIESQNRRAGGPGNSYTALTALNPTQGTSRQTGAPSSKIDFVLVYTPLSPKSRCKDEAYAARTRDIFENGLRDEGLILEKDTDVENVTFVKIYAPNDVLKKYAEILKLKMPMKQDVCDMEVKQNFNIISEVKSCLKTLINFFIIIDAGSMLQKDKITLLAEYSRDKNYLFDEESPNFFSPAIRILVVDFILGRQSFSDDKQDAQCVGIQRMISDQIYKAAYPLHDGDYKTAGNRRSFLYSDWAKLCNWIKFQPIDDVKEYLGVKYAFYFAWLGFYTNLLIPISLLGLAVLIFGIFTIRLDGFSQEVCENSTNIIMCPLCDRKCDYWKLSDTCWHSRVSYLFENELSVIYAFLISVWASLFLESWKRYSATLAHNWGLTGYTVQAEHPRPEFLAKLHDSEKKRVNVVTGFLEPRVSRAHRFLTISFSYTIILTCIVIALIAVFAMILYRMWLSAVTSRYDQAEIIACNRTLFISTTAAILNLISIMILNKVYSRIAVILTDMELPRTQTDYERSLTIKIYIFQFVNYYSSIIYIAFFKGKFVGYPSKYNTILGYRQEECSPSGCYMDLTVQLATIMIGRQLYYTFTEMIYPVIWNFLNIYSWNNDTKPDVDETTKEFMVDERKPWIEDYKLLECETPTLFNEYLEMVMQFGFATLFVSAFPLAPLFALINNIFELRLDAQKMLRYYRRPVPHLIQNIGVWYRILDIVGKLAVFTNAAIIAFSSSFIPRLIYGFSPEPDYELSGYLNFTLSFFNTSDFTDSTRPENPSFNVTYCRYTGYREPPWSLYKYKRTVIYWKIFVARLIFIIIFQNVVFVMKVAVQWLIPDMPRRLREVIKRETYLATQLIVRKEKDRAGKNKESL